MKQSTLMFVAIASILCFPTLMKAQENEPCIVRSRPANTELSNILQFRYMWLYSKAFPDDSRYVQHIHSTQDAFGTEITESMKLKLDAHRMRFVIYDGASYNAKTKQLNVMQMLNLPSGSFVEQVEDFTLCNPGVKPFPAEGIYQGTEFTIMLPSTAYSWDYTDGFYGAFTAYGYYYIDPIGEMFASPPPTTNDTGMNGRQGQFNGNISGVLGNFNMGWGYFQAFVPRGGHVKKLGIFDTGVDTLHRDMNQLLIDTAESYSIPTSNRDIRDYDGHGTRSMSCMAARGNNLYGMTGADINDTVVVYKVWSTTTGPISAVSTAINMSYTAHVTDKNFSLGSTTYDPTLAVNIANGYSTYNSWSYAAAGNSGSLSNTTYPACLADVWSTVGTLLGGGAWSGSTTSDSAFTGVLSYQVYSAVAGTSNVCNGANGTSFGSPQTTGFAADVRNLFPDFNLAQTKALYIRMLNGGGTRTITKGYGILTDSLVLKEFERHILASDTVTFPACSGKHRVGELQTQYFWSDSGFVGTNALLATLSSGDSVNSNLVSTGTYFCRRWVKSIPDIPGYSIPWYDSSRTQVVIVTTGVSTISTASISVSPGSIVCSGTSVTFTCVTSVVGGAYQWKKNGVPITGATSPAYSTSSLLTSDVITCQVTPTTGCYTGSVTSSGIAMTVNVTTTSTATIAVSPGSTVCSGTMMTFTVTTSITGGWYQWYKNGIAIVGATSSTYTISSLTTGDIITCTVTPPSGSCYTGAVTSAGIAVTVNPVLAPTISITQTPSGSICSGASVTFTSSITSGGSAPSYAWTVNGVGVGSSPTYSSTTFANGDVVICTLTSSAPCAMPSSVVSNTVTLTVNPSVPAPICTVSGVAILISAGVYKGLYTAAIPVGITTYVLDWYLNGMYNNTSTTNTWVHNPMTNGHPDTVQVVLKPTAGCYAPDSSWSGDVYLHSPVSITSVPKTVSYDVYPNPVTSILYVEGAQRGDVAIITNILGQNLKEYCFNGSVKESIDIAFLPPGIYSLRIVGSRVSCLPNAYKLLKE